MSGPANTSALTTHELVSDAVAVLNDGDVVLGFGEIDYAAANMLDVLRALHGTTGIDLELLPQVREFARLVVEGWDL